MVLCEYGRSSGILTCNHRVISNNVTTTLIQSANNGQLTRETNKEERIVIRMDSGENVNVALDQIVSLSCSQENKHFKIVNFADGTVTK